MRFPVAIRAAFFMSLCCISRHAEADDIATKSVPFCLPQVQLRTESHPKPAQPEEAPSPQPTAYGSIGSATLESALGDSASHSRVVRSGEFYLTRIEGPLDTGVLAYVDRLFTPEVVKVGRASVSCPLVIVINRKNPLCLLSGFGTDRTLISYIFLQVSW
jgi:hypothetical protein